MIFRIGSTFTDSLSRLTGAEQKQVKTAVFDLQVNSSQPGLQMHKLRSATDRSFWSVRVNRDIRIIVHRTDASTMFAYVDHHDKAYAWAERHRIDGHYGKGEIQVVQLKEEVEGYPRTGLGRHAANISGWLVLFLGLPLALNTVVGSRQALRLAKDTGAFYCQETGSFYLPAVLVILIYGIGLIVNGMRWRRPFNAAVAVICFVICLAITYNVAHTMLLEREQLSDCP